MSCRTHELADRLSRYGATAPMDKKAQAFWLAEAVPAQLTAGLAGSSTDSNSAVVVAEAEPSKGSGGSGEAETVPPAQGWPARHLRRMRAPWTLPLAREKGWKPRSANGSFAASTSVDDSLNSNGSSSESAAAAGPELENGAAAAAAAAPVVKKSAVSARASAEAAANARAAAENAEAIDQAMMVPLAVGDDRDAVGGSSRGELQRAVSPVPRGAEKLRAADRPVPENVISGTAVATFQCCEDGDEGCVPEEVAGIVLLDAAKQAAVKEELNGSGRGDQRLCAEQQEQLRDPTLAQPKFR